MIFGHERSLQAINTRRYADHYPIHLDILLKDRYDKAPKKGMPGEVSVVAVCVPVPLLTNFNERRSVPEAGLPPDETAYNLPVATELARPIQDPLVAERARYIEACNQNDRRRRQQSMLLPSPAAAPSGARASSGSSPPE